ncbi:MULTISPECIES: DUF4785 domain-containing protein [Shewanella]|uniref:DUF4785 family protein n=1 Tax=Shewanella marisflavi TaxID=260364 RepID=A0ABX5WQU4_9GAMM|nr:MULTISPECIES: DUF4785 domain-containing protein [Shewanella]QDF76844.1 DUF4785 family protein [Shewanella marisflavi]
MKPSIKMASVFALSVLLSACQSDDPQTDNASQASAVTVTQVTLLAPSSGDLAVDTLAATELPPVNGNRGGVSFSAPIKHKAQLIAPTQLEQSSSDQYWRTVTGAELNQGIMLAVSQSDSVIRVAPRGDVSSGALRQSPAISPDQLRLYKVNKQTLDKSVSLIQSMSDPQAMATAGIVDDSSALRLSKRATPGMYQLQVVQPLSANDSYLVNVKEKGSPYQLTLSAPKHLSSQTPLLAFDLKLSNSDIDLSPTATLKQSDGRYHSLAVVKQGNKWQAQLPDDLTMPSSNLGLSEIQLDIETRVNGLPLIRTVKTAFKQYVPAAKLLDKANIHWQDTKPTQAVFDLQVASPGRYQVSAVLAGTDAQGKQGNILRAETAQWLDADGQISLSFDAEQLAASGLVAPYAIKALELKDQSQMARLSYLGEAASL